MEVLLKNLAKQRLKYVGQYMEDTIESNPEVTAIVKVLKLWFKIYTFLKKADVDHTYPAEIKQFEVRVRELYECGKHTFLTKAGSDCVGDAILYAKNCQAYVRNIQCGCRRVVHATI